MGKLDQNELSIGYMNLIKFCEDKDSLRYVRPEIMALSKLNDWKIKEFTGDGEFLRTYHGKGIVFQISDMVLIEFIFFEIGTIQAHCKLNDETTIFRLERFPQGACEFLGNIPDHRDPDIDDLLWKLERILGRIYKGRSHLQEDPYNPIRKENRGD